MTRDIHLIFYPSPLFPAHWGLWIPSVGNPQIGKMVHVVGDVATGFEHQFKRNYSLITTTRRYDLVLLAKVDDKHVVDVPGNGEGSSDKNPADDIERKALTVPAPGKSLISASSQVGLLSHFLSCTIC